MANTKQAKKRARQAEKHRQHNASRRSMLRTLIKNVHQAIIKQDVKGALKAYQEATPTLDRFVTKKIIHKNAAARYKHRMHEDIKSLGK